MWVVVMETVRCQSPTTHRRPPQMMDQATATVTTTHTAFNVHASLVGIGLLPVHTNISPVSFPTVS